MYLRCSMIPAAIGNDEISFGDIIYLKHLISP